MKINWTKNAASDLKFWQKNDQKIISRIKILITDLQKDPKHGIGKPEPLKYNLSGCWSRRITGNHRLVYLIKNKEEVTILQCRYHY